MSDMPDGDHLNEPYESAPPEPEKEQEWGYDTELGELGQAAPAPSEPEPPALPLGHAFMAGRNYPVSYCVAVVGELAQTRLCGRPPAEHEPEPAGLTLHRPWCATSNVGTVVGGGCTCREPEPAKEQEEDISDLEATRRLYEGTHGATAFVAFREQVLPSATSSDPAPPHGHAEIELDSPHFTPAGLEEFAARGFERVNRHGDAEKEGWQGRMCLCGVETCEHVVKPARDLRMWTAAGWDRIRENTARTAPAAPHDDLKEAAQRLADKGQWQEPMSPADERVFLAEVERAKGVREGLAEPHGDAEKEATRAQAERLSGICTPGDPHWQERADAIAAVLQQAEADLLTARRERDEATRLIQGAPAWNCHPSNECYPDCNASWLEAAFAWPDVIASPEHRCKRCDSACLPFQLHLGECRACERRALNTSEAALAERTRELEEVRERERAHLSWAEEITRQRERAEQAESALAALSDEGISENHAIHTLTGDPRPGFSLQQEIRAQLEETQADLSDLRAKVEKVLTLQPDAKQAFGAGWTGGARWMLSQVRAILGGKK